MRLSIRSQWDATIETVTGTILGLASGDAATVLVKASEVSVAVD
jgi:molybdopterin-binding protein